MTDWSPPPAEAETGGDAALKDVVAEIAGHVWEAGWDQRPRLFALVDAADLLAREPHLAEEVDVPEGEVRYVALEQEDLPAEPFDDLLLRIEWPDSVAGCAAAMEWVVLPPEAEAEVPEDETAARAYAAEHPDREEVRVVAGVTRTGATYVTVDQRDGEDPETMTEALAVGPALLQLLQGTFEPDDGQDPSNP